MVIYRAPDLAGPPPDLAHAEDGSVVVFSARGTAAWSENRRAAWRASSLVWPVKASPNMLP